MNFFEAMGKMKKGEKVKLPEWGGYCYWDDEKKTVMIQHWSPNPDTGKDMVDIRECPDTDYIARAILYGDWQVADESNCEMLDNDVYFDFGTAIKCMKCGAKVLRKGWKEKGFFIFLADCEDLHTDANLACISHIMGDIILPFIVQKTDDDKLCVGWTASQMDILAEDWTVMWS